MPSDAILRVRYAETDQMGIVYHGNYYTWFEVGRSTYFRNLDYSYKRLEEENLLLPVLEASCKYIKAAKYDDEIIIRTRIAEFKGIRITFEYQVIRKADNVLLATGMTKHGIVNKELVPVKLRSANPRIYAFLKAQYENDIDMCDHSH